MSRARASKGWIAGPAIGALALLGACSPTAEPGRLAAARDLAPCPARPNCVWSRADLGDGHRVEPFRIQVTPERAWRAARDTVAALPRTRIVEESSGQYLRAEVQSLLFRFTDDLELRLDTGAKQIDVRSASRLGYSDLGVNRARIEALRAELRGSGFIE